MTLLFGLGTPQQSETSPRVSAGQLIERWLPVLLIVSPLCSLHPLTHRSLQQDG